MVSGLLICPVPVLSDDGCCGHKHHNVDTLDVAREPVQYDNVQKEPDQDFHQQETEQEGSSISEGQCSKVVAYDCHIEEPGNGDPCGIEGNAIVH